MAVAPPPVVMNPLAPARSLNSEPPGGMWHFFLSHYQLNGGASMLALSEMLEKRGLSCWCALRFAHAAGHDGNTVADPRCPRVGRLDKNGVPSEEGMMEGVTRSNYFLLYLTRGVFKRKYVLQEIRMALKLRKPFILLWEAEERGQVYKDEDGNVQSTVASIKELQDEMPRHPADPSRGEFSILFEKCVCVKAQFHADVRVREAMLDSLCDHAHNAFLVPWAE